MEATEAKPKGGSRAQRRRVSRKKLKSVEIVADHASSAPKKIKKETQHERASSNNDDGADTAAEAVAPAAAKKTKKEKRREQKAAGESMARACVDATLRVFVGHLPQSATEDEIRHHFRECGGMVEVDMMRRNDAARRFKGSAFLILQSEADVAHALSLHQSSWRSTSSTGIGAPHKVITVERAKPKEPREPTATAAATTSTLAAAARPTAGKAAAAPAKKAAAAAAGGAAAGAATAAAGAAAATATASCFVADLPADVNVKDVRRAFRAVCGEGSIRKVKLLAVQPAAVAAAAAAAAGAPANGTRKAFIDFTGTDTAALAVGCDGKTLAPLRAPVRVTYSQRVEAPSGGGRRSKDAKKRRRERRDEQRGKRQRTSE